MKRSEMLTALSHDHHQALRASQLLGRSDEANADEIRESFERFWESQRLHRKVEEEVLFPTFASYGGAAELLERALNDYAPITVLADGIIEAESARICAMHDLAEMLENYVRFEERELFPAIEKAIPVSEKPALEAALRHEEISPDWQPLREL